MIDTETLIKTVLRDYPCDDGYPIVERKRNPHLDHLCITPEFEVFGSCHNPDCQVEEIAEVYYKKEAAALYALETCGIFVLWAD
jgi:hypothetical protein